MSRIDDLLSKDVRWLEEGRPGSVFWEPGSVE